MNKYIKLAACALAVFGLASCNEEKIMNVDVTAVPEVSNYADNFVVSVDQETNTATFTFTGEGVYPVWIIDGKYNSAPTVSKYQRKKGEYFVEAKVGNANGISTGSLTLPYTIEKTKMSGFGGFVFESEHNMWPKAEKSVTFWYAPGWNQIADPAHSLTDEGFTVTLPEATTDQWQAQCHIQTDICLAAGEHFDGSFIFTTSQDLGTGVLKIHPQGDDDDAHSFFPNAKIKTTANEPVTFWFSDLEAAVDMNNLVFTLDFGGNPAGIEIIVDNIVLKNHIYDDGTVLPELPSVPEPNWVAVDSPENLWNSFDLAVGFYYAPGWSQLPDPVLTIDGNSYTIELPSATYDPWQAQMFMSGGPSFNGGDCYDFKVEFETNVDLPKVTAKFTQDGDDNNFFFSEDFKVAAGTYSFWVSGATAPADMPSTKYVFDFGGNPDGAVITMKNIIIQKHFD